MKGYWRKKKVALKEGVLGVEFFLFSSIDAFAWAMRVVPKFARMLSGGVLMGILV